VGGCNVPHRDGVHWCSAEWERGERGFYTAGKAGQAASGRLQQMFVTVGLLAGIAGQSSSMKNPILRLVDGGSALMSFTSWARRSMSSTSTSITEAVLQLLYAGRDVLVGGNKLAQANKGSDNEYARVDSTLAAKNR